MMATRWARKSVRLVAQWGTLWALLKGILLVLPMALHSVQKLAHRKDEELDHKLATPREFLWARLWAHLWARLWACMLDNTWDLEWGQK